MRLEVEGARKTDRLSDRQRIAVLLGACVAYERRRRGGLCNGWVRVRLEVGQRLRVDETRPGEARGLPATLERLRGALFARRPQRGGRGEGLRASRRLQSLWENESRSLGTSDVVGQILASAPFLWGAAYVDLRTRLAMEEVLPPEATCRFVKRELGLDPKHLLCMRDASALLGRSLTLWSDAATGGPSLPVAPLFVEGIRSACSLRQDLLIGAGLLDVALECPRGREGDDALARRAVLAAEMGRLDELSKTLERLAKTAKKTELPPDLFDAVTRAATVGALRRGRLWLRALERVKWRKRGFASGMARRLAIACAQGGGPEETARAVEGSGWRTAREIALQHCEEGEPGLAKSSLHRSLELQSASCRPWQRAQLLLDRGGIAVSLDEREEARRAFEKVLDLYPYCPTVTRRLAQLGLAVLGLRSGEPVRTGFSAAACAEPILRPVTMLIGLEHASCSQGGDPAEVADSHREDGAWISNDYWRCTDQLALLLRARCELSSGRRREGARSLAAVSPSVRGPFCDAARGLMRWSTGGDLPAPLAKSARQWVYALEAAAPEDLRSAERLLPMLEDALDVAGRVDPAGWPRHGKLRRIAARVLEHLGERGSERLKFLVAGPLALLCEVSAADRVAALTKLESLATHVAGRGVRVSWSDSCRQEVSTEGAEREISVVLHPSAHEEARIRGFFESPPRSLRDLFAIAQRLLAEVPPVTRAPRRSRDRPGSVVRARRPPTRERIFDGASPEILLVEERLTKLARSDVPVLVLGETGTGKELAARALHERGGRRGARFVPVNCGGLSTELIQSELFGYVKGSFTGAAVDRAGLFETAHGGTLFLDEIAELPAPVQASLLRVLQDGEVRRVGDVRVRHVDTRVVAATHMDLERQVARGEFRRDLLFRLRSGVVEMPPLRERGDDVALIADAHLATLKPPRSLVPEARVALREHAWTGNVRELLQRLDSAAALSDNAELLPSDVGLAASPGSEAPSAYHDRVLEFRRTLVTDALERSGGCQAAAARVLGISRQTMSYLVGRLV